MFETIEKLRQKPPKTKKLIAFSVAFFLSGIIFVVWLSVIYPDFRRNQLKKEEVSKLEPSPLGTFGETLKTGIFSLGEQIGKLKESISSLTSAPAYYSTTTDSEELFTTATSSDISATTTEQKSNF